MNQNILTIATIFSHHNILTAQPFGSGNINDTYLVQDEQGPFILQRLNAEVFPQPQWIFANQLRLQHILTSQISPNTAIRIPRLILTVAGHSHHKDSSNRYWRGLEFIDNSQEIEQLKDHQAESVGRLLGTFHHLGKEQGITDFHDTLPGLHATTAHLQCYAASTVTPAEAPQDILTFCAECIVQQQDEAIRIDQELQHNTLPKRLIHGDPKLANILFDKTTHKACSLIDLDTIGPGIIHHDLSDLIRSCCNLAGEDSPTQQIHFDLSLAEDIITGYSKETASFLTPGEINLLGESLWLMPFELGVRFLNDYLAGSTYFKTSSPHHNLLRAQNQFQLAKLIQQKQTALQAHVNACFN